MKLPFLKILFLLLFTAYSLFSFSINDTSETSTQTLHGGIRFQKAAGFYWINGISAEYSCTKIWNKKISLGFNLLSSKLGSALNSTAIPYFEANVSAIYYFRNQKQLQPLLRLNTGYARANYGSDTFKKVPNQSMLLSFETGIAYNFKLPVKLAISGGYNFITGNGNRGLGVLFPVYAQLSIFYRILN